MNLQEFFYITASIAFVLLSLFLVGLIYLAIRLERLAKLSMNRVNTTARDVSDYFEGFARTWGTLTLARVVIKLLKTLVRR